MPSIAKSDYSITLPSNAQFAISQQLSEGQQKVAETTSIFSSRAPLPASSCSHFYVDQGKLVVGDWKSSLMRWFVPYYASNQDKKVSEFFIHFFTNSFSDDLSQNREKFKSMIISAEQHIARHQGWFSRSVARNIARLEVYTLAARTRINTFESGQFYEELISKGLADNRELFNRWTKAGFAEDAFWTSPDLVDFIFKTHLHRHIIYPHYKHTIDMRPCLLNRDGQLTVTREPHLLVNGIPTPWAELRNQFKVDEEFHPYKLENGKKERWGYLENGLTRWDGHNFEHPQPLRKLSNTPLGNRVEIVTSHAHKNTWRFFDSFLKGSRHSFFRIIPGRGFSARHPEVRLTDGAVYSFGWAPKRRDVNFLAPLSTMKGFWRCPDGWEFAKEDLCATPINVSDPQLLKLLEIVKKHSQEDLPFHAIIANCSGAVVNILREADGIVNLCPKDHMVHMWYLFLLPKYIRRPIDQVICFLDQFTPSCISNGISTISKLIYSAVCVPIFSLLGAWRTNIAYEDENGQGITVKTRNKIKAFYSNVFDMFNPDKMVFDLTKNIYRWQKTRPETYLEKHD